MSCNKKEFLDEKPDSNLSIPTTLVDFRRLLDNDRVMSETPVLGELSADNYYLLPNFWQILSPKEKNAHTWSKEIYQNETGVGDWNKPYEQVFYANVTLEGLDKMKEADKISTEWKDLYGTALFIRSYAFYNVAQVFASTYDINISQKEDSFGIPLRFKSDISIATRRASVKETYDTILVQLKKAVPNLANNIPTNFLNRPSKAAAYALLARVYLSMRNYDSALHYAEKSLSLHAAIHDFNTPGSIANNVEVLYQSKLLSTTSVLKANVVPACIVDSTLYRSYNLNDRRRITYFNATPNPRASYALGIFLFSGLATDEVYLIKSECLARKGNFMDGINVLNTLLEKRFTTGTFIPLTASTAAEAVNKILDERRKELVFRGQRWTDLRRLNKDGAAITLTRKLDKDYFLPPNDPKYVLPLPPDVQLQSPVRN